MIGEGGSGGALGIGVGDRVLMLEHAYYSVISPEGCAAILWGDAKRMADAAKALKLTARDLKRLGIVDEVLESRSAARTAIPPRCSSACASGSNPTSPSSRSSRSTSSSPARYEKFRKMGSVFAPPPELAGEKQGRPAGRTAADQAACADPTLRRQSPMACVARPAAASCLATAAGLPPRRRARRLHELVDRKIEELRAELHREIDALRSRVAGRRLRV